MRYKERAERFFYEKNSFDKEISVELLAWLSAFYDDTMSRQVMDDSKHYILSSMRVLSYKKHWRH